MHTQPELMQKSAYVARKLFCLTAHLTLIASSITNAQTVRDDVGYTALNSYLANRGQSMIGGDNLTLTAIEPIFESRDSRNVKLFTEDALGNTIAKQYGWVPNPTPTNTSLPNLQTKTIIDASTIDIFSGAERNTLPGDISSHATEVARWYFSTEYSLIPNATEARFYNLNDWIERELQRGTNQFQRGLFDRSVFHNSDVISFSAVGSGEDDSRSLRQIDWAIKQENQIAVISAGNNDISNTLASSSYNGIYAGITAGTAGKRTPLVDALYSANRQRPDIVAPMVNTSRGTAVVSSAAGALVEAYRRFNPLQQKPQHKIVKSVIMAGADRKTNNTRPNRQIRETQLDEDGNEFEAVIDTVISDITDYRENSNITNNGLDSRYGAGQLNEFNSYRILEAGEQDSQEDGGNKTVSLLGYDYDSEFGLSRNRTATYQLDTLEEDVTGFITAAWDVDIYGLDGQFSLGTLYSIGLNLFEVLSDGSETLIASSTSLTANTQNIHTNLSAGGNYYFEVFANTDRIAPLLWDYAIAWRFEDVDKVQADLALLGQEQAISSQSIGVIEAQAVPLPASLWLLFSGLSGLLLVKFSHNKRPI